MSEHSCKPCTKSGLFALAWMIYILILIPTFLWSSQALQGNSNDTNFNKEQFSDISILRHQEHNTNYKDWILNSNVCPLGKLVFYFIILMYLVYLISILFVSPNVSKILSYTVFGITSFIYICMLLSNVPFAIRSIPTFLAAISITIIGVITN